MKPLPEARPATSAARSSMLPDFVQDGKLVCHPDGLGTLLASLRPC